MSVDAQGHEVYCCELCDAEFPTCGVEDADERAFAAGWKCGHDGWVCPRCEGDIEERLH